MGILNKAPSPYEEALYKQAYEELEQGKERKGLWAKAVTKSKGDTDRAESIYIELRVDSLRNADKYEAKRIADDNRQADERAKIEAKEIARKKRKKFVFWVIFAPLVIFIIINTFFSSDIDINKFLT